MGDNGFMQGMQVGDALKRLERVLNASETNIWEVDLDAMTVQYFGPVEDVSGVPAAELDDPLSVTYQIVHPEDQQVVIEQFEPLMEGRSQAIDVEFRTHPDNGPVRWLRIEVFSEEPGSNTLFGMTTDITAQKEYEARLESFAGVVSHDLRNPLSVAKGRLELAQLECSSDHLDHIASAHDRMERLIEELLSLARENQAIGEMESVALDTLVEACWATVDTNAASLDVTTEKSILADESRLKQVFENVFRNAIEHGGESVTVTVGDLDDGFYVADDGVGIAEGERDQLFTGATAFGAVGIGLRIVRQIVEAHGWSICVVESDDGGARFEITSVELG